MKIGKLIFLAFIFLFQFFNFSFFGFQNLTFKWLFLLLFINFTFLYLLFFQKKELLDKKTVTFLLIFTITSFFTSFHSKISYQSQLSSCIIVLGGFIVIYSKHVIRENVSFLNCFIKSLFSCGVFIAVLGLYQYFSFIFLDKSESALIPFILPPIHSVRIAGPYGQPNLFALLLVLALVAGEFVYQNDQSINSRHCFYYFKYLPSILISTVFFLTGSKAGYISLVVSFGLLLFLFAARKISHNPQQIRAVYSYLLWAIISGFLISILISYSMAGTVNALRVLSSAGISTEARFVFWMSAILMFIDHPLFGIGLDNYKFLLSHYQPLAHKSLGFVQFEAMGYTSWAHNETLQLLCEGGIFQFLIILLLLFFYLRSFKRQICNYQENTQVQLILHILILPFIVQSMFSWPVRYPPLFALFFCIVGFISSSKNDQYLFTTRLSNYILGVCLVSGLLVLALIINVEIEMASLKKNVGRSSDVSASYSDFVYLAENPYSKYRMLNSVLPIYVSRALRQDDIFWAAKLIPHARELATMQGAYWQWYNLALLCQKAELADEAREAVQKSILSQPTYEPAWQLLHYLDVVNASRITGKPVESYYRSMENPKESLSGAEL